MIKHCLSIEPLLIYTSLTMQEWMCNQTQKVPSPAVYQLTLLLNFMVLPFACRFNPASHRNNTMSFLNFTELIDVCSESLPLP